MYDGEEVSGVRASGVDAELRAVADAVESTLGPFGHSKLLLCDDGTVTVTASAAELLERLDVDDPTVALLEETVGNVRDREGDGAGTVVVLAGALLAEAARLVEEGLYPTAIERGYRHGCGLAFEAVDEAARPLSAFGLAPVARTALTGTRVPRVRESVAERVAEAVESVGPRADRRIGVVSRPGGGVGETELVRGAVVEEGPVLDTMPRSSNRPGVAVLSSTVDVPRVGSQTGRVQRRVVLEVDSLTDREAVARRELAAFESALEATVDAGCGALFTERAINERVQSELAASGVLGVQRVDSGTLRQVVRATGAAVVPTLEQVTADALGTGSVEVRREAGRDLTVVTSESGEPTYTMFCRAPDPRSVTAFERSVEAAIAATAAASRDERVVPGGGAVETAAAAAVRRGARGLGDRRQYAVEAFGEALLAVPGVLAETAGLDRATALADLRAAHADGRDSVGVDVLSAATTDVLGADPVVDPVPVKRGVLSAATELAVRAVRTDERLEATDLGDEEHDPPEGVDPPEEE